MEDTSNGASNRFEPSNGGGGGRVTICGNELAGVGKAAPLTGKGSAGETGFLAKEASAGVDEGEKGRIRDEESPGCQLCFVVI